MTFILIPIVIGAIGALGSLTLLVREIRIRKRTAKRDKRSQIQITAQFADGSTEMIAIVPPSKTSNRGLRSLLGQIKELVEC